MTAETAKDYRDAMREAIGPRVALGAELLDEVNGGADKWINRVDSSRQQCISVTINGTESATDVLTQMYSDIEIGASKLGIPMDELSDYGFVVTEDEFGKNIMGAINIWKGCWTEELRGRAKSPATQRAITKRIRQQEKDMASQDTPSTEGRIETPPVETPDMGASEETPEKAASEEKPRRFVKVKGVAKKAEEKETAKMEAKVETPRIGQSGDWLKVAEVAILWDRGKGSVQRTINNKRDNGEWEVLASPLRIKREDAEAYDLSGETTTPKAPRVTTAKAEDKTETPKPATRNASKARIAELEAEVETLRQQIDASKRPGFVRRGFGRIGRKIAAFKNAS